VAFALEMGLLQPERQKEPKPPHHPTTTTDTTTDNNTTTDNTKNTTTTDNTTNTNTTTTTTTTTTPTPLSVAVFLYQTKGLDKALVGDYLAEPPDSHPFNTRVRNVYVTLFDFKGMTFDGALRLFLSKFRLPGEAQKIDRLLEAFADRLYAAYHPDDDDAAAAAAAAVVEDTSNTR
jgi:Sec7-like guanine-nucleotide exchange factor